MRSSHEMVWSTLGVAGAAALYLALAANGRPGPGGFVGHTLGIIGTLLILFAWLGYSWRKRETRTGPGSMQTWLGMHIVAGIVGSFLVLLHSAFAFRGLAGIVLLLALAVTASGVVGRYAYTRAAREPGGARAALAAWWLLHVPLAAALLALALVHIAGALYYGLRLR